MCIVKVNIKEGGGEFTLMSPLPFLGEPVTRAIMSPPTDRISPCLCRQSLASLNYMWRCEKNGEIVLRIDFLQRFALTFFIIEVL
jgi:hypothetical protein